MILAAAGRRFAPNSRYAGLKHLTGGRNAGGRWRRERGRGEREPQNVDKPNHEGIWEDADTPGGEVDGWRTESETCDSDNLYVNLGEDAYIGPGGEDKPPTLGGWLDVHMWHESGCDPEARERLGFVQETWWGLDPAEYDMDSLSSAWVDTVFEFHDGDAVVRTLSLDLAWVAQGDRVVVKGRDGMIVNGWERSAQLSGAITDSWELIDVGDLKRANMMTAHYLMR